MKGKNIFTASEIGQLRRLILLRLKADRAAQKLIRGKMRRIGFYGQDDWGITNLKLSDFDALISSGQITVVSDG